MLRLNSQLTEVGRQINSQVANIRASIKAQYDAARLQEQMLEARIEQLKGDELDLQDRSIRYNMLKRELDTNAQLSRVAAAVQGNRRGRQRRRQQYFGGGQRRRAGQAALAAARLHLALAAVFGLFAGLIAALLLHVLRPAARARQ